MKTTNKKKEYQKEYRIKNKDKIKEYQKEYQKEYYKEYRIKNKDKIKEYQKEYQKEYNIKNKDKIKEHKKEYYKENKGRCKEYQKQYRKDTLNRILENIGHNFRTALKKNEDWKKRASIKKLVACTKEVFITHIESLFTSEMSWDNYGTYWNIDHIIPVSIYDLSILGEQYKCHNYKNLRPLEAIENSSKCNKLDKALIDKYDIKHLLPNGVLYEEIED